MSRITTEEWKQRQEQKQQDTDWFKITQQFIPIVLAFGGLSFLFAGLGFLVFNVTLGFWTDIQLYDVSPNQYIPTGVLAFIFLCVVLLPHLLTKLFLGRNRQRLQKKYKFLYFLLVALLIILVSAIQASLIILVYSFLDSNSLPGITITEQVVGLFFFVLFIYVGFLTPKKLDFELLTMGAILLAFILGALVIVNGAIPRSIGGGRPATVQLLFQDADIAPQFNLPLSSNPQLSETVCLLAELNDSYLIYVPSNVQGQQYTVTIPDDMILSIRDTQENIDCRAPRIINPELPSPTPQPSPTP